MYINTGLIVEAASVLTAVSLIFGFLVWCSKFVESNKRQDRELQAIRKENTMICYGVLACLKGLKEQGCDGPVRDALNKLEKHLNSRAHDQKE